MTIIFKELFYIYQQLAHDRPLNLTEVTPYRNYIKWLNRQNKDEGLAFWKAYLEGFEQPTGLTELGEPGKPGKKNMAEYDFWVNDVLTVGLTGIARDHKVTINTVFQAIWGILLHRYHNTNKVVYARVVSGRPPEIQGIENMIGLFINTIPIRITLQKEQKFSQLLREVLESEVSTKPYEYLPLAEIQAQTYLKSKLIDHLFGYENYLVDEGIKRFKDSRGLGLGVTDVQLNQQVFYDFVTAILPENRFHIKFFFNTDLFAHDLIKKIARHFHELINQVVYNPDIKLQDLIISDDLLKISSKASSEEYINFKL